MRCSQHGVKMVSGNRYIRALRVPEHGVLNHQQTIWRRFTHGRVFQHVPRISCDQSNKPFQVEPYEPFYCRWPSIPHKGYRRHYPQTPLVLLAVGISPASREEVQKDDPEDVLSCSTDDTDKTKWEKTSWIEWLVDPIRTVFRLCHLLVLFAPVFISIPLMLAGRKGNLWWFRVLTWSMESAGASFTKLGQWAASRTDIFPEAMCEEMSKLHSDVRPHSLDETKRIVSQAFGIPFDKIFDEFDERPLGVGAMGQVYRAKLSREIHSQDYDGDKASTQRNWVAVKVLHPGVARIVELDLAIMRIAARVINLLPTMEWLSLPDEVNVFGQMMAQQLDLRVEARNLKVFRKNFAQNPSIHFPKPLTVCSSRDVLVEEYIQGISMSKVLARSVGERDKMDVRISSLGLNAFLEMLLIHNFIHTDLHPGNIYVRFVGPQQVLENLRSIEDPQVWRSTLNDLYSEGYRPQLSFIDAGLVTELSQVNRRNFLDLFKAMSSFDGYRVGELMIERSRTPEAAQAPDVFALKIQRLVHYMKTRTFALGNMRIGDLLGQVLSMVREHHVRMEGDFVTVVLSILLLEGMGRKLDPELDLFKRQVILLLSSTNKALYRFYVN